MKITGYCDVRIYFVEYEGQEYEIEVEMDEGTVTSVTPSRADIKYNEVELKEIFRLLPDKDKYY